MAYITFKNKTSILVLKAFEAAAFVNEYLRSRNEEEYEFEDCNDALAYGCQIGCIAPLADDQFKRWHIEVPGHIFQYDVNYLTSRPGGDLYYVDLRATPGINKALKMFDETWRIYRTYTLYYEWED